MSYTAGTIWPYKFIMGLLSKIVGSSALNVQAHTPVTSVASESVSSHLVNTPRGSIRASKVIYATNAYAPGLLPEYSSNIVPVRGLCCHIAVPEGKHAPFLPYSYILNGDGCSYLISRPDGSIVVGGAQYTFKEAKEQWYGVVDDSTLIEPAKDYYKDYMQRTFQGWEDSGAYVKEIWTGSKFPFQTYLGSSSFKKDKCADGLQLWAIRTIPTLTLVKSQTNRDNIFVQDSMDTECL